MYFSENFLELYFGLIYNIRGFFIKNFEVMIKYRFDIFGLVQINIYMIYKICLDCVIVIVYIYRYIENVIFLKLFYEEKFQEKIQLVFNVQKLLC